MFFSFPSQPRYNLIIGFAIITIASQLQCISAIIQNPTRYGQLPTDGIYGQELPVNTIQWTGGSFEFPCPSTKSLFKSSGKYISKNVIATRAQISGNTAFLALPRFRQGIPSTLVKTQIKHGACVTTFLPFPCWSMQEEGNCKALQSVVDIFVDQNDILWALDTGIVNTLETAVRKCPPKIVAINIKNGKVLKTIELDGLTSSNSRLQYLAVDYSMQGQCFVYVADAANRAIIVYNLQQNKGYRVILPKAVSQGCRARDVLYIALIRKDCGSTVLYLTYLSSKRVFTIPTEFLRSGSIDGRVSEVGTKPNRLVIVGTDNGAAIFFRNEGESEVYRWDTTKPFSKSNFTPVYRSPTCQLATHVLPDYKRNTMRVLQSNFPDYMQNTVGCGATQQLSIMSGCW